MLGKFLLKDKRRKESDTKALIEVLSVIYSEHQVSNLTL